MLNENVVKIQKEAIKLWSKSNRGTLQMQTGVGKTKIAIDIMNKFKDNKILIVVPTELSRDINFPEEINKWSNIKLFKNLKIICYKSLLKIENQKYKLVILDEIHNLTDNNILFFNNNKIDNILGLSATIPPDKISLLEQIKCPIIYSFNSSDALKNKTVSDFNITIMNLFLDNTIKEIESGNQYTKFKQTEYEIYTYYTKQISRMFYENKKIPFKTLIASPKYNYDLRKRKELLYNLPTKRKAAKKLINNLIEANIRTLLFFKSIALCEEICGKNIYHSKTDNKKFIEFKEGKINYLGVVDSLNEAITIPNLNNIVIVQCDSSEKNMIQRIGRTIRLEEENKVANILIFSVKDTKDEDWVKNALSNIDKDKIEEINFNDIKF